MRAIRNVSILDNFSIGPQHRVINKGHHRIWINILEEGDGKGRCRSIGEFPTKTLSEKNEKYVLTKFKKIKENLKN